VLVVDDNLLFAEAIQAALSAKGFDVATAADAATAFAALDGDGPPDVVLIEVRLAGGAGFALGTEIRERHPMTRVIALTGLADAAAAAHALEIGFAGYLSKDTKIGGLVDAIRTVAEGGEVETQTLPAKADGSSPWRARQDSATSLLAAQITPREREILELLSAGYTSGEIERTLGISRNTVRTHVQNILAKLGVHSRLEAATFAVEHGIVSGLVPAT
jgi:DNA-binding NarL/FixJ family response regulator